MLTREDMPAPEALIAYEHGVEAAMFFYAPDDADMVAIANYHGFHANVVTLDSDRSPEAATLLDEYSDGASDILARWSPPVPDGWMIAAKYDTEEGPCAIVIRRRDARGATHDRA